MSNWRPRRGFRVGKMRERINIQQASVTETTGQPVRSWANLYASEPASFEPASGGETIRGRQVEANVSAVFIIHKRTGINTEMRVVHDSTNYGIVRVLPVEGGNRYIELHCRALAN